MSRGIEERYFLWLVDVVGRSFNYPSEDDFPNNYMVLFHFLHGIEFRWVIDNDINRAADGIDLRGRFATESRGNFYAYRDALMGPCSVFEALVALAKRCEESIMEEADFGDRTGQWFWIMIQNLGLDAFDNSHFDGEMVSRIVDIFLDREYEFDGSGGGLFVVPNPPDDMRYTEIWYQLCWWLDFYINTEGEY